MQDCSDLQFKAGKYSETHQITGMQASYILPESIGIENKDNNLGNELSVGISTGTRVMAII